MQQTHCLPPNFAYSNISHVRLHGPCRAHCFCRVCHRRIRFNVGRAAGISATRIGKSCVADAELLRYVDQFWFSKGMNAILMFDSMIIDAFLMTLGFVELRAAVALSCCACARSNCLDWAGATGLWAPLLRSCLDGLSLIHRCVCLPPLRQS